MMGGKTRILLADDHVVVRMGVAAAISFEQDLAVAGEAADGQEAVRMAGKLLPDVVVMDLMMPRLGGTEATLAIKEAHPEIRILILTSFMTSADLGAALRAGASGALPKTSSQAEIVAAIRKVAACERVISRALEHDLALDRLPPKLTGRQIEVLRLAAKGFTSQDIGSILAISQNSVKDHFKLIYQRLGVSTRAEAIAVAMHGGMLSA